MSWGQHENWSQINVTDASEISFQRKMSQNFRQAAHVSREVIKSFRVSLFKISFKVFEEYGANAARGAEAD